MTNMALKYLEKAVSLALIVSTSAMVLVVMLQIFARFALPWSPDWTEEMARFCFIYMVSLGAGLALKENAYVGVLTILEKMSDKWRRLIECVILGFIAALMFIMFIFCFPLMNIVKLQTSAALQINMAVIYFAMMLMSFLVMLYAILRLVEKLHTNNRSL